MPIHYEANPGKHLVIIHNGKSWLRIPIKTPVFKAEDSLGSMLFDLLEPHLQPEDIVFISEKCVACTQGRAIELTAIKPSLWAKLLSRFVTRSKHGIGLALPETMEMAIQECGLLRILLASVAGAVGKLFHQKGWFYRIASDKAAAIDGPCSYTLPPYNHCVVLAPENPNQTACCLQKKLGHPVLIVDINDLGGKILGSSDSQLDLTLMLALLKDNPLGQANQQTPVGILRKIPT